MLCSCALKIQSEPNGKREVFGWGGDEFKSLQRFVGHPHTPHAAPE